MGTATDVPAPVQDRTPASIRLMPRVLKVMRSSGHHDQLRMERRVASGHSMILKALGWRIFQSTTKMPLLDHGTSIQEWTTLTGRQLPKSKFFKTY
jgi:hypothetical protein